MKSANMWMYVMNVVVVLQTVKKVRLAVEAVTVVVRVASDPESEGEWDNESIGGSRGCVL